MPAHTYEGMFLLDSTKAAAAWDDTVKHVHDILTKHNSEIVASRQWDEPAGLPDRRPQEGDVSWVDPKKRLVSPLWRPEEACFRGKRGFPSMEFPPR